MKEFDCAECGIHIIDVSGTSEGVLCLTCIHLPGWFNDPQLRDILDREGAAQPPKLPGDDDVTA